MTLTETLRDRIPLHTLLKQNRSQNSNHPSYRRSLLARLDNASAVPVNFERLVTASNAPKINATGNCDCSVRKHGLGCVPHTVLYSVESYDENDPSHTTISGGEGGSFGWPDTGDAEYRSSV